MAEKLSPEGKESLKEIFNVFDRKGIGWFGTKQLQEVMTSYGMNADAQEVKELINEMDITGNETVTFDVFVEAFLKKAKDSDAEEELREALKLFDKDGNGFLSTDELRNALTEWGEGLTSEEVDEMIHELEVDNREIDFEELITIWMSAHKSK